MERRLFILSIIIICYFPINSFCQCYGFSFFNENDFLTETCFENLKEEKDIMLLRNFFINNNIHKAQRYAFEQNDTVYKINVEFDSINNTIKVTNINNLFNYYHYNKYFFINDQLSNVEFKNKEISVNDSGEIHYSYDKYNNIISKITINPAVKDTDKIEACCYDKKNREIIYKFINFIYNNNVKNKEGGIISTKYCKKKIILLVDNSIRTIFDFNRKHQIINVTEYNVDKKITQIVKIIYLKNGLVLYSIYDDNKLVGFRSYYYEKGLLRSLGSTSIYQGNTNSIFCSSSIFIYDKNNFPIRELETNSERDNLKRPGTCHYYDIRYNYIYY